MSDLIILIAIAFFVIFLIGKQSDDLSEESKEIDRLKRKRGEEAESRANQALKRLGFPYLNNIYIQDQRKNYSSEIDLIAPVGGEIWIIEVKGWRGTTKGDRSQNQFTTTTKKGAANRSRANPFHQLGNQRGSLKKFMKARQLNAKLRSVLLLTHGTPHISGLREDEYAFSLTQLKSHLRSVRQQKLEPQQKKVWQALWRAHHEADPIDAAAFHNQLIEERKKHQAQRKKHRNRAS